MQQKTRREGDLDLSDGGKDELVAEVKVPLCGAGLGQSFAGARRGPCTSTTVRCASCLFRPADSQALHTRFGINVAAKLHASDTDSRTGSC